MQRARGRSRESRRTSWRIHYGTTSLKEEFQIRFGEPLRNKAQRLRLRCYPRRDLRFF